MSKPPRSYLSVFFAAIALILASQVSAFSQEVEKTNISTVKIKNFGQMDDRFFRGGQPKENQYDQLAALGIKTVIDLQDEPTAYEKQNVEALGMKYINIPMSDKDYPESSKIEQFLKLVGDNYNRKIYEHSAGGSNLKGVMGDV
jgi:protein tyrosine phosphatase (PTP) superfamily phosphohydrolase (DUF442 family)